MSLNRSALSRKSSADILNKIKKSVETKKTNYDDERVWKLARNEDGVGYAVIRFLPSPVEDGSYVRPLYTHGFKSKGGWLISECPTSVDKKCPICEHNSSLWNSGIESDKNTARDRGRRTHFLTNILVVKDPAKPENEGKVFIWGMGKKMFEKAKAILNPPEEFGEEGKNPWSFFDGLELRLKMKTVSTFPNYDDSSFVETSVLFDGEEEKLEELLNKCYDLDKYVEEIADVNYGTLSRKFAKVIGLESDDDSEPADDVKEKIGGAKDEPADEPKKTTNAENDELMSYFKALRDKS
jgi:hypothetical protein